MNIAFFLHKQLILLPAAIDTIYSFRRYIQS